MTEFIGKTYSERPLSDIIKSVLKMTNQSRGDAAKLLGTTKAYFDNKISRDSFSIEDLVAIAWAGDCYICIKKYPINESDCMVINPGAFETIRNQSEKILEEKRLEYESLRKQVADLETRYGFCNMADE